jgi:3-phosphoshikimate 1-carboxyvinyltransferase
MTSARAGYNPRMATTAPPNTMGLRPADAAGGRIEGRLRVPGSKSIAQRAIVCAALAEGTTEIAGLPDGADVRAAERVRIRGLPSTGPYSAGESGTLARFVTAAVALCGEAGKPCEIGGEGSLLARRSPALFRALREAGAELECLGIEDGWPVRVKPGARVSRVRIVSPSSSQEVSALWIALAARAGTSTVEVEGAVPSRSYLELTRRVLLEFGARVEGESVVGPLRAPVRTFVVEPDASSAAVVLAASWLSGGRVEIEGLASGSAQPDARIVEHLARFGGRASVELDLADTPDLAPVLAAVAAGCAHRAGASSRLAGLATLPGKESSRIEVLARGLSECGFSAVAGPDFLEVGPGTGSRGEVHLDPRGDHRMAFAFALLGLVREGVLVRDPRCVSKSWPGFWEDRARAGARVRT